ncbi:LPS export ABC transporter periplasmic protein LptC [Pseudooceanicola sp. LIPI14-2-Ac024]|uniref:LPS export ABC transporter periplasmic protein LptC n=1 Tax=Pseudooceanicola sp. LIPI14-2-Ac024 TaxID=3344875 RepID=UPI0035D11E60
MARRDRHTRVVGWLKIALPLMALAILSTLFLLSRRNQPVRELPFAQVEMEERARSQQITQPTLSGASDQGDLIAVRAASVRPDPDQADSVIASDVTAQIDFVDGGNMTIAADTATFARGDRTAQLRGNVRITSSSGQQVRTEALDLSLDTLAITSPTEVQSDGPEGRLTSGGMQVTNGTGDDDVQLVFTGGVKLVYEPGRSKE